MVLVLVLNECTVPSKQSPGCASGSVDGTSTMYPTDSLIGGLDVIFGTDVIDLIVRGDSLGASHIISGASYAYSSISSVPTDE